MPGVSVAQIVGPLKFNSGPTQTHALVVGSPALDAADPAGCRDGSGALLQTDQRGFARHVDGNSDGTTRCDIGAFEFGADEFGAGSATLVDFDGDGKSDIGVYRNGTWFILRSSDGGVTATAWGGLPKIDRCQETMTEMARLTLPCTETGCGSSSVLPMAAR